MKNLNVSVMSSLTYQEFINVLESPENLQIQKNRKEFVDMCKWIKGEKLHEGGQGEVFRMICIGHGHKCARKEMKIHNLDLLKTECFILTLIKHPNVLQYYDCIIDYERRLAYIYMELMRVSPKFISQNNTEI